MPKGMAEPELVNLSYLNAKERYASSRSGDADNTDVWTHRALRMSPAGKTCLAIAPPTICRSDESLTVQKISSDGRNLIQLKQGFLKDASMILANGAT